MFPISAMTYELSNVTANRAAAAAAPMQCTVHIMVLSLIIDIRVVYVLVFSFFHIQWLWKCCAVLYCAVFRTLGHAPFIISLSIFAHSIASNLFASSNWSFSTKNCILFKHEIVHWFMVCTSFKWPTIKCSHHLHGQFLDTIKQKRDHQTFGLSFVNTGQWCISRGKSKKKKNAKNHAHQFVIHIGRERA